MQRDRRLVLLQHHGVGIHRTEVTVAERVRGIVQWQRRDEILVTELLHSVLQAKVMAERYHRHYNSYRPCSSLSFRTPN